MFCLPARLFGQVSRVLSKGGAGESEKRRELSRWSGEDKADWLSSAWARGWPGLRCRRLCVAGADADVLVSLVGRAQPCSGAAPTEPTE